LGVRQGWSAPGSVVDEDDGWFGRLGIVLVGNDPRRADRSQTCIQPASHLYDARVSESLPIAEFAFPGPLRDALVGAILDGSKTSTTGLLEEYHREGTPVEAVGARELVVDSAGRGVAVIETTESAVRRMRDVDLRFAIDEGEGFETVEAWYEAHVRFFTSPETVAALGEPPVQIDGDTLVVCTRFRVIERL
jgi:uncharacterized protein YhfF